MRLWRLTVSCKEKTFGLIIIYSTSCRNSCRFHVHVYIHDKTTLKSGTFRVNWSSCKTLNPGPDLPAQFWNLLAPPFTLSYYIDTCCGLFPANRKARGFQPMKKSSPTGRCYPTQPRNLSSGMVAFSTVPRRPHSWMEVDSWEAIHRFTPQAEQCH